MLSSHLSLAALRRCHLHSTIVPAFPKGACGASTSAQSAEGVLCSDAYSSHCSSAGSTGGSGLGSGVFKVALTGGICTGKSTVASQLRTLGFPVFDSDAEVHSLYSSGTLSSSGTSNPEWESLLAALQPHFPSDIFVSHTAPTAHTVASGTKDASGTSGPVRIDRQALGKVVLADPAKLRLLEGIVHPLVRTPTSAPALAYVCFCLPLYSNSNTIQHNLLCNCSAVHNIVYPVILPCVGRSYHLFDGLMNTTSGSLLPRRNVRRQPEFLRM